MSIKRKENKSKMAIHKFNNGTVYTGDDIKKAILMSFNKRNNYDIGCNFCTHQGSTEYCNGCSIPDDDRCCSCHINPPCSACTDKKLTCPECGWEE